MTNDKKAQSEPTPTGHGEPYSPERLHARLNDLHWDDGQYFWLLPDWLRGEMMLFLESLPSSDRAIADNYETTIDILEQTRRELAETKEELALTMGTLESRERNIESLLSASRPTLEMVNAGAKVIEKYLEHQIHGDIVRQAYLAMIDAAPKYVKQP